MSTVKFVQAKATTLQAPIVSTEVTSIVLKRLVDIYGNALALSDFGTIIYLTLEPGSDNEEIISATGFTVNADDTVTLDTGIVRGLSAKYPYTTGGTAQDHSAGSTIIVSNNPQLYASLVALTGAQTIDGIKTFLANPLLPGSPTLALEAATKAYVDSVVAGIATTVSLVVPGVAGETVAAGNLIYLKVSDGRWWLCDADTAGTVDNIILAIAQGAGTAGNSIASGVMLQGMDSNQSGLSAHTKYYASNTAGAISSSVGTTEVTVGVSHPTDATKLYFYPRYDQEITEDLQDALVGDGGTPSATNKFLTQTGFQTGAEVYGASAVGTDSYAITPTPAISAYATGMIFRFKADVANTGAASLAVSGLSAITIKKLHDQDLATGDIEVGQIVSVVYNSIGPTFEMQSQLAVPVSNVDIQVFSTAGTTSWTKPSGAKIVDVYCIGAGGGGGSGKRNASSAAAGGGGGGGGGSWSYKRFAGSALGSTETVVVGAGGPGGAAKSSDGDGNAGTNGGASTFGTSTLVSAPGGALGAGGVNGNAAGGVGGVIGIGDITIVGGAAGRGTAATSSDAAMQGVDATNVLSPRGGGGGFGSATSVSGNSSGGGFLTYYVKAGGVAGVSGVGTAAGTAGTAGTTTDSGLLIGGVGGGGGGGNGDNATASNNAGAGGAGGFPGGGGGGGGGADSTNNTLSGAGGTGADGLVVVISYF